MSVTYHLVCVDCEERIWVGQNDFIYDPHRYGIDLFLHKHIEHNLMFVSEHHLYSWKFKGVTIERKLIDEKED